jgi:hypothetical protein
MNAINLGILKNANSGDNTSMQYKGVWKFNVYDPNYGLYLHMKTNINTVNMWMFEAIGYNYCQGAMIRSAWTFHWDGGNLYSLSYTQKGPNSGCAPTNVYMSVDGYVVLVANSPCWGYCGFVLNAYNTADIYNQNGLSNNQYPQITASLFSAKNGGAF